jgi:hypothetical protein
VFNILLSDSCTQKSWARGWGYVTVYCRRTRKAIPLSLLLEMRLEFQTPMVQGAMLQMTRYIRLSCNVLCALEHEVVSNRWWLVLECCAVDCCALVLECCALVLECCALADLARACRDS